MSYIISAQARRRYGLGEDFVMAKSGALTSLYSATSATPAFDSMAAAVEAARQAELRAAMIAAETTVQSKGYKTTKATTQLTTTSPMLIATSVTAPAVTALTQPSYVEAKTVSPTALSPLSTNLAPTAPLYTYAQAAAAAATPTTSEYVTAKPQSIYTAANPQPTYSYQQAAVQQQQQQQPATPSLFTPSTPSQMTSTATATGTPPPASQNMTPTYGEQRPGQQVMVTTIGPDGRPLTYMTSAPQYVPGQAPGGASQSLFESSRSPSSAAPRTGGGTTVAGQKADATRAVAGKDGWFTDPATGMKFTASEVEQAKSGSAAKSGSGSIIPAVAGLLSWFLLRR